MKSPEPRASLEAIASHLHVPTNTVDRWIAGKDMPSAKGSSRRHFRVTRVDDWARSGKAANSEDPEDLKTQQ